MNNILAEKKKKKRPGLWANIHKRRAQGKRPHRPGEKGYPKTLDIKEENTMKLTSEQLRLIIAEEVANINISQMDTRLNGVYPDDSKVYNDVKDLKDYLSDDLEYNTPPTDNELEAARRARDYARFNRAQSGISRDRGLSAGVNARDSRGVGNESSRRRGKRIAEGHARITEDEVAAWKNGDWGYNAQQDSSHDHDRFLHGSESGHPMDDEGYMIKSRMSSMKTMAADICSLLDSEDQLPSWVQDLVASSHSDMQHVYDYLMGDEAIRSYTKSPTQNVGSVVGESHLRKMRRLAEGHARITQEEFAAWKNGDWGFVSENSESSSPCDYCGEDIKDKDKKSHEQECSSSYSM